MDIILKRTLTDSKITEGQLSINGKILCNTLELANRDLNQNGKFDNGETKLKGYTCIPYGKYKVIVSMSPRFGRELPLLLDVPEFEGIRIHRGNTIKDTAGCILPGNKVSLGKIANSTKYELELTSMIKEAISRGEKVYINIV